MEKLKISTVQFENRSDDKNYNLSVIDNLSEQVAKAGSQVIAFHECSLTGYTFARPYRESKCCKWPSLFRTGND